MRVLHIIPNLQVGGAETMLTRLMGEWAGPAPPSPDSVVVCLDDGGPYRERIEALGVPVWVLADERGPALFALIRIVREFRPDIIQTWMYRADLMGTLASRVVGQAEVVWNLRCSFGWAERGLARRAVFRALRLLSFVPLAIVSNTSRAIAEHKEAGYRGRRWKLIPNGFDTDVYRPDPAAGARLRDELGLVADATIIGMVARFDPLKDHLTFLHAASHLAEQDETAHFVLVGARLEENLAGPIRDLGLSQRVHILGHRDDVAALLPGFDIATLSSLSEGFPNVVGEAMACALPCVSTRVGDVGELLDNAWTVEPGDPVALAGLWQAMLKLPPEARSAIGQRNRARIVEQYSIEAVADTYLALYRSVLNPRSQGVAA